MDSEKLLQGEFRLFGEFNLLNFKNNPNKDLFKITGVYVLCLEEKFDRLLGKTDVLYIGQSGGAKGGKGRFIVERLTDYCVGAFSAPQDKRIHDAIEGISRKLKKKILIFYKNIKKDNCEQEEQYLLKEFEIDHLELPPWNRQLPKSKL